MTDEQLEKMLSGLGQADYMIEPSFELIEETKTRIKNTKYLTLLITISMLINVLLMLGALFFILSPVNILIKISVYVLISCMTNLSIILIYMFRDFISKIFYIIDLEVF